MNKISLTFTANQQELKNTTKNVRLASGTVDYIDATFELGNNWSSFDSVRAVWSKKQDLYSTVLDAYGYCKVPDELLADKGTIKVNLVGSIAEEQEGEEEPILTDRLTTYQTTALSVTAIVPLEGEETSPLTPSQFEQYVLIVHGYADDAVDAKEAAETAQGLAETAAQQANIYQGWAQNYADNARGYANDANNSKWAAATSETNAANSATAAANSATTAQGHATSAQTSATNASESAIEAGEHSYEAQNYAKSARSYAVGGTGSRAGEDTDNAMYYNSQASASAQAAEDAKDEAETIAGSMVTNLKDGSATGSVRGINATGETSSYTMGQNAFAEGSGTKASGLSSHAEGGGTTASGPYAHAEGGATNASGQYAHAEGNGTTASEDYAHAEGLHTTASGYDAHAEGYRTTASQGAAHAEGADTTASAPNSHAEGDGTVASGQSSHAEGYYTTASSSNQHVEGRYNIPDENGKYAHIIGNGTYRARSNAYTVDWDGNVEAAGDITDGNDNILSNKVDKVTGKGLSTEDYTTEEKTKLGTIEEGAQVNIPVDEELSDTSTNPVQNKAIKRVFDKVEEVIDKLAITDEASGSGVVTIPDGANLPMKSLKVTLEPIQSGSGTPSPDNVRPISGYDEVSAVISPTTTASDGQTYTADLGQTVYGGTVDLVSGVVVIDRAMVLIKNLTWVRNTTSYPATPYFYTTVSNGIGGEAKQPLLLSSAYRTGSNLYERADGIITNANYHVANTLEINVFDSQHASVSLANFLEEMGDEQIVYPLATPQTIQLTPQVIEALKGVNNVWSNGDSVYLHYVADTKLYILKVTQ